ncbi:MAG TPA: hypothetical protein VKO87_08825 [Gemmatimonadaceae bacterium]|nr:hypothetical protein [Gemmatimonadaceae bacterium]
MKYPAITALVLLAGFVVGCDGGAPVEPGQQSVAPDPSHARVAADALGGKPEIDPTYANGKTVYMIGPHMVVNARETMPNTYQHAEELYLVVYPQQEVPAPGAGPITLPSGYQPQCDPCFHPGLPAPFVYHDHVIPGAPGMGTAGTASGMKAPWKLILLMYNPAYVLSPTFTPLKSEAEIDAAEEAGNVFLPINAGGDNQYEIDTGNLLICPIVSSHA